MPTVDSPPASIQALVLKLNPHLFTPPLSHPTPAEAKAHIEAIDDAIDLCNRLLRPDATKRLTAAGALRHPFLRPQEGESMEDVLDEQALMPHEGKCGDLHITNDHGMRECHITKHPLYSIDVLQTRSFSAGKI